MDHDIDVGQLKPDVHIERSDRLWTVLVRWWRHLFRRLPGVSEAEIPIRQSPSAVYRERKRNLPYTFTTEDWLRALEFWDHCCAICGRPRGLWHTISQDHWIPLTHPKCPGTVPTNILPLCYGADGCNNSKGKKDPKEWLVEKFGKRRAARKLAEIEAYFAWIREQSPQILDPLTCPYCDGPLEYLEEHDMWLCTLCDTGWQEAESDE